MLLFCNFFLIITLIYFKFSLKAGASFYINVSYFCISVYVFSHSQGYSCLSNNEIHPDGFSEQQIPGTAIIKNRWWFCKTPLQKLTALYSYTRLDRLIQNDLIKEWYFRTHSDRTQALTGSSAGLINEVYKIKATKTYT